MKTNPIRIVDDRVCNAPASFFDEKTVESKGMRLAKKIIMGVIALAMAENVFASEEFSDGGSFYAIFCNTSSSGLKAIEAYPDHGTQVQTSSPTLSQDQRWIFEPKTDDRGTYYLISCNTKSAGKKYIEAFPRDHALKLMDLSGEPGYPDQKWRVEGLVAGSELDDGLVHTIYCVAEHGTVAMEAYPRDSEVKAEEQSATKDQKWRIIKWAS